MKRRELLQMILGGAAVSVVAACAPLAPTAVHRMVTGFGWRASEAVDYSAIWLAP